MKLIKRLLCLLCAFVFLLGLMSGCAEPKTPKIGVSFGAGSAARWPLERQYMEEYAQELGVPMEIRFNTAEGEPTTQTEDCIELIDSGINVLILMPRDANNVEEILDYAKAKNVKVISYARAISSLKIDLFVGYDCYRIGQALGQYLSEMVYQGDYILLKGDPNDNNAVLLYDGAMRYIEPIRGDINVLLDEAVPKWLPETAKEMVKKAVAANGNHVDAILAPNDALAGACAEALADLGVTDPVIITGMDAELSAANRIINGTQSSTVYMDLKELARAAVDQANHLARGEEADVNAEFSSQSGDFTIASYLITGQLVTSENLDRILIDSGYFTREEVYGS